MEPLQVEVLQFYPRENAQPHNTAKYEVVNDENPTTTIVRRGQTFDGAVRFTRPYDEDNDIVQLVFSIGNKPCMETVGRMFIQRRCDAVTDKHTWSANLLDVQEENTTLSFNVSSPVTAPVGAWALRVVTWQRGSTERAYYDFDQSIYILFNPWNTDDQTYMEDEALLQEYVLNDVGKIWQSKDQGRPWLYGQFDAVVLPACMFMLDRAKVPFNHRGDPVKMTRAISRIVNSNDDYGVLMGRWNGNYKAGTSPSEWTGSVDILAEFLKTKKPVAYGQCWVFAGVVNTVCRALGIPSRVVTNLISAHDANSTLSVDVYYSETMERLHYNPFNKQEDLDSVWNFHVWNDVWMARPDLAVGYGGWQAIDATPQEKSEKMFQCGPAPLEAIKQGDIGRNYDVAFILASVNADLMRWRIDSSEETGFAKVDSDTHYIGSMVLTKKPYVFDPHGEEDREDITEQYKYREGTDSNRNALMHGVGFSERAKRYYQVDSNLQNNISFKLHDLDAVPIGKDFRLTVDIENTSDEGRQIKATVSTISLFYNGVKADVVKNVEEKIFVRPGEKQQISIEVKSDDYLSKLVEYYNMRISAMAIVDETKQSWAHDHILKLITPNINIQFNDDLILNQPTTAVLSFTNPLERALTGCEFCVTSSGIEGRTLRFPVSDGAPLQPITAELTVQPKTIGIISFVATFKSVELQAIRGAATANVIEA